MRIDRLASDELEVEMLPEAGARLHRVRAFGQDVMRTPDDLATHLEDPFSWGGYHMLPWTNRIAPGPLRVGSRTLDLRANFRDGTAIHGLHYVTPWAVEADGAYSANGGGTDGSGWPWEHQVRVTVKVSGPSLFIGHEVTNLSDDPMPAGAGIHPWFVEPVQARIRARQQIASNLDPDAPLEPVSAELDMSSFRALPEEVDAAWAGVEQPVFELRWPKFGISASLRTKQTGVYVVAANPRDADGVAIEPQTHAPWGMRRLIDDEPGGLRLLAPGETLRLDSEIEFRRMEAEG